MIAKRTQGGEEVIVCVATEPIAKAYERKTEFEIAAAILGVTETIWVAFPELKLDFAEHEALTDELRRIIEAVKPDDIFTPHPGDLHTDHKALTAAVTVAIRAKYAFAPMAAYTYETLSETSEDFSVPAFKPNMYVDISETLEDKIAAFNAYQTQQEHRPGQRNADNIRALATYRGGQAGMMAAEAFSVMRIFER